MSYKPKALTHARVSTYRVTMNDRFDDHFLVNPDYVHENELLFIYKDNGVEVHKKVPVNVVIKHCKVRPFFGRDPQTLRSKYKGYAYEVPADVILTYKA